MKKLEKIAKKIINESLKIQKNERVLILTDPKRYELANSFFKVCSKTYDTMILTISEMKYDGAKLSDFVKEHLKICDVLLAYTTMSVSHTKSVLEARSKGVRVASLPGITKDIYKRAIDIDFKEMAELTKKLRKTFEKGSQVKVTTEKGTDISFSIKNRPIYEMNAICKNKGDFINLPDGEMMVAPIENSMNGKIVVDLSMMPDQMTQYGIIGKLENEKIILDIKKGEIVNYSNNKASNILKNVINSADKNANIIAEFAIGTNPKAKIIGNILEDEKVLKTCHFAFGSNTTFGGNNQSNIHLDGIIDEPTIYLDGIKIIENGNLI
ncbi:MAG: aminopeptidase [Bacillota bacterium]